MPVKDMKPIDLENVEVRSTDGRCFKEISRLSEDEDLSTTPDFKDLASMFIELSVTAADSASAIVALLGNIRSYLGDKHYEGYSNNWMRMHGLKPYRRPMKWRRYKPCGKGRRRKRR